MGKNDLLHPELFRLADIRNNQVKWDYIGIKDNVHGRFILGDVEGVGILSFVTDGSGKDIYSGDTLYQYCGVTDTVQFYRIVYEQGVVYAKTKIRVTSKDKVEIKDVKMTLKGMDSKSLFIAGNDVEGIYENYREEFEEYINYLTEGLGLEEFLNKYGYGS